MKLHKTAHILLQNFTKINNNNNNECIYIALSPGSLPAQSALQTLDIPNFTNYEKKEKCIQCNH